MGWHIGGFLGKVVNPVVHVAKQAWPQVRAPAEAAAATYVTGNPAVGKGVLKLNQAAQAASQAKTLRQQQQAAQAAAAKANAQAWSPSLPSVVPAAIGTGSGTVPAVAPVQPPSLYQQPIQTAPVAMKVGPVLLVIGVLGTYWIVRRGRHGRT